MERIRAAVIGCGCISDIYLKNLTGCFGDAVEVVSVCDIIPERALEKQKKYSVPKAVFTDEEIMDDPSIEAVLDITPPQEHAKVNLMAIQAGKHVFCEKPLACTLEDGLNEVAAAREKGVLLGGAPDTFMGGGIQTCKKLIEDGWIGTPVAAEARMLSRGPESWHPDPDFFYHFGAGPLFDMGPYYVTALINLLGPVSTVTSSAKITFPERTATCKEHYGETIHVTTPTHAAGILGMQQGAIAMLTVSFDVWNTYDRQPITVYGSKGTLRVPDPNTFGGRISLLRPDSGEWEDIPLLYPYTENSRGLGFTDFCRCIRSGKKPYAYCDQTLHVLDVMSAFYRSSEKGTSIAIEAPYEMRHSLPLD